MQFPPLLTLLANSQGRDIFVGDLHGELDMLLLGLAALNFDPACDRLISVGDVIDRGPHSAALLRLLIAAPWFYGCLGNHEALLHLSCSGNPRAREIRQRNGGDWFEACPPSERAELAALVTQLPIALAVPISSGLTVGIVHAETPPDQHWDQLGEISMEEVDVIAPEPARPGSALLWGRSRYLQCRRHLSTLGREPGPSPADIAGVDLVVCGHSVLRGPREPAVWGNSLMIDTGAYEAEGRLTFVNLYRGTYMQVAKTFERRLQVLPERAIA